MNAVGIIAEYNPFHNGHKWHIEQAKKISGQDYAIAVMSGNFVQRGEPAIFDKWERAAMAVHSGIDLVIELPAAFAIRSAQYFASGSIRLLHQLGIVSHLCFGAETAELNLLERAAQEKSNLETTLQMKAQLKTGTTYAAAIGYAVEKSAQIDLSILKSPNNILAIEYLDALKNLSANIIPIPIKRHLSQHDDMEVNGVIASAGSIRKALASQSNSKDYQQALPEFTLKRINELLIAKRGPAKFAAFSSSMLSVLRTANSDFIEQLPDVSEGLHNRIKETALKARNADELLSLLKTKRYTHTRLQRIVLHALLGTNKKQLSLFDQTGPLYARVLAFNTNGRKLLKAISEHSQIPVITKTSQFLTSEQRNKYQLTPLQKMLSFDTIASDLYVLALPSDQWHGGGLDFRLSPRYIP